MKRKLYVIPKMGEEGTDVAVDAKKFDAALQHLLKSEPIQNSKIAGKRSVRKMDNPTS